MNLRLMVGIALMLLQNPAMAQETTQSVAWRFQGCELRRAAENGPPGRFALFCPGELGVWTRVPVEGLAPDTPAKAAAGDIRAMAILGAAYTRPKIGRGEEGRALLERAAAAGDTLAMVELGRLAYVEKLRADFLPEGATAADHAEASRKSRAAESRAIGFYRQAADKGDIAAMRMMSANLKAQRPEEATAWLRRAAEAGDAASMVDLAQKLTDHEGKTGDPRAAESWLQKAAEAGELAAMNMLASNYQFGWMGMKADPAHHEIWSARADAAYVEQLKDRVRRDGPDLEPSMWGRTEGPASELGDIYFEGRRGIARDASEGLRWYALSAEHGDEHGAAQLAEIYRDGRGGVSPDKILADRWDAHWQRLVVRGMIAAAERGEVEQMKRLAVLYITGQQDEFLTVPKDVPEGVRWLRKSIEASPNDAEALTMLATLYREGNGVEKDLGESKKLDAKAAAIDPTRFGDLDNLIATLDGQPGYQALMASQRLFQANRPDEGVFWYYVGQLRGRMEAQADSTAAQLYGAIFATVGPDVNAYAWGDINKMAAMIDRVLAWDAAHPLAGVPKSIRQKQRDSLADLKIKMVRDQDKVRSERTKNGLPNS